MSPKQQKKERRKPGRRKPKTIVAGTREFPVLVRHNDNSVEKLAAPNIRPGSLVAEPALAEFLTSKFGKEPENSEKLTSVISQIDEFVTDKFRAELSPASAKGLFESTPVWKYRGASAEGRGISDCFKQPCSVELEQINYGRWITAPNNKDTVGLLLLWNTGVIETRPSRGLRESDHYMLEVACAAVSALTKNCWLATATPFREFKPKAGRHGHRDHWLTRAKGELESIDKMPRSGATLRHADADKLVSFFNREDAVFEGTVRVRLKTYGKKKADLWLFVGPARIAVSIRLGA